MPRGSWHSQSHARNLLSFILPNFIIHLFLKLSIVFDPRIRRATDQGRLSAVTALGTQTRASGTDVEERGIA